MVRLVGTRSLQKEQDHRARLGLGPVLVLNFLYPSIRVRTAPPVLVRVRANISLFFLCMRLRPIVGQPGNSNIISRVKLGQITVP